MNTYTHMQYISTYTHMQYVNTHTHTHMHSDMNDATSTLILL